MRQAPMCLSARRASLVDPPMTVRWRCGKLIWRGTLFYGHFQSGQALGSGCLNQCCSFERKSGPQLQQSRFFTPLWQKNSGLHVYMLAIRRPFRSTRIGRSSSFIAVRRNDLAFDVLEMALSTYSPCSRGRNRPAKLVNERATRIVSLLFAIR